MREERRCAGEGKGEERERGEEAPRNRYRVEGWWKNRKGDKERKCGGGRRRYREFQERNGENGQGGVKGGENIKGKRCVRGKKRE